MAEMIWHDSNYSFRLPILVLRSATANYFAVAVSTWFDPFWTVVQSTGFDVRFYRGGGGVAGSLQTHNRASWTYASRLASFNVTYTDGAVADTQELYWMYYGYTSAADGSTAITATVATTAVSSWQAPASAMVVVGGQPVPPGQVSPPQRISKTTFNSVMVCFDVTPLLGEALASGGGTGATAGRRASAWKLDSLNWNATTGTGVYSGATRQSMDNGAAYPIETIGGGFYIVFMLTGGTVDIDYTVRLRGTLTSLPPAGAVLSQVLDIRALLQVRDPLE